MDLFFLKLFYFVFLAFRGPKKIKKHAAAHERVTKSKKKNARKLINKRLKREQASAGISL